MCKLRFYYNVNRHHIDVGFEANVYIVAFVTNKSSLELSLR